MSGSAPASVARPREPAGSVISVNIGQAMRFEAANLGMTGIDKRPVEGPVRLAAHGVEGDHVADLAVHGGTDQAVYAYATEDAGWWAAALDRELRPGNFGENLTTVGIDVTGSVIGDRWAVGDALLEVSAPRIPCKVFAAFWDVPDLIKRFTAQARPGAYLRVLTPGSIRAGDPVTVAHRPDHGVTIGVVFRALTLEPDLLPRLLHAPELPEALRRRAARRAGVA